MGAILDATAALIAEEGVAAVTMHRVARLSGTTTGSMYHFFPDRETLLGALVERHEGELRALMEWIARDAAHWAPLTTDEVVGRLLDPFLAYSEQHPDLLPLMHVSRATEWGAGRSLELSRLMLQLATAVVASRCPNIAAPALALRAATMAAIMDGVAGALARTPPSPESRAYNSALRRELRRALVAYLDSYAAGRATAAPGAAGADRARTGRTRRSPG